jgi:transcriptional regulator with XRE-family HTH domain
VRGSAADQEWRVKAQKVLRENLRPARNRAKLSQADVAERIGIAIEVYGKIERGHRLPRLRTLVKLALALKVSVDVLLGMDVPRSTPVVTRSSEDDLPPDARPVLRSVRELKPEQIKLITKTGCHLIEAKAERRRRREERGR